MDQNEFLDGEDLLNNIHNLGYEEYVEV